MCVCAFVWYAQVVSLGSVGEAALPRLCCHTTSAKKEEFPDSSNGELNNDCKLTIGGGTEVVEENIRGDSVEVWDSRDLRVGTKF